MVADDALAMSLTPELDPRARHLLRALIARYIKEGEPVGSRTLARASGLELSPATIRNVMADLEELGLVAAPHTSAGRVPTAQGYRIFVNMLLEAHEFDPQDTAQVRIDPPATGGTNSLLANASSLLSAITHFVGLVTVPRRGEFAFRQIDFVPIGDRRLLVILVFTDNEVQNRVIEAPRAYTPSELDEMANFLNANFAGLTLDQIRARIVTDLAEARSAMDRLMLESLRVAETALRVDTGEDVLVSGQTNLLGVEDLADTQRLRELFDAFQRKHELLRILDRCIHADGVRLFIGEESGCEALESCSVVAAPYSAGGKVLGVIGVIGPTRMAYERVIPVVQTTACLLSSALNRVGPAP